MTNAAKQPPVESAVGPGSETSEMLNLNIGGMSKQIMDAGRHNLELAMQIANATFEGVERVGGIQLEAAKSAHASVAEMQKAIGRTGLPSEELWAAQRQLMTDNVRQGIEYWVEMLGAASCTNAAITQILNGEVSQATLSAADTLQKAVGSVQLGVAAEHRI